MAAAPNGKYPDLTLEEARAAIPDIPEGASDRERARAYATAITHLAVVLPKVVQALDFLRQAGQQTAFEAIGARKAAEEAKGSAVSTQASVERIETMIRGLARWPPLPPMRPESSSSHELLERLDDRVTASFEKMASQTPGPLLAGSPPELAAIAREAAAQLLLEERERIKREADAQRLADYDAAEAKRKADIAAATKLRKDDVHKLKWKLYGTAAGFILLAIVGAIGTVMWTGAKVVAARELGHSEGVREMQSVAAPATAAPPGAK